MSAAEPVDRFLGAVRTPDQVMPTGGWRTNHLHPSRRHRRRTTRPRLAEPFATIIREAHEHRDNEGKGEHEHDNLHWS